MSEGGAGRNPRIGEIASAAALAAFASTVRKSGRALVVGAVITDGADRIYVQQRSLTRALFPGCWDLVGGHAEGAESILDALAREVREETGWRLEQVGPVVEILDWEANGAAKGEIDFLVTVSGDLHRPRLEPGKHSASRWLTAPDVPILLEGRRPDDRWVYDVVVRAFELLRGWNPAPAPPGP